MSSPVDPGRLAGLCFMADGEGHILAFSDPVETVRCHRPEQLQDWLTRLETRARAEGLWLAGGLRYEAGRVFEGLVPEGPDDEVLDDEVHVTRAETRTGPGEALAVFHVYREAQVVEVREVWTFALAVLGLAPRSRPPMFMPRGPEPAVDRSAYNAAFAQVQAALRRGDSYQINLTMNLDGQVQAPYWPLDPVLIPLALYCSLLEDGQGLRHGAFLTDGDHSVLSLSPELFFRRQGQELQCRPMKGTAARLADPVGDADQVRWLANDPKNQAENLMIVDMIRNDLGRIARPGSVAVPRLFAVESYATVHQMVSEVRAGSTAPLGELMAALFPCASITGAPKHRTMQLITDLERRRRGWYTGCLGWVDPRGGLQFNVAIRSLVCPTEASAVPTSTPVASGDLCSRDHARSFSLRFSLGVGGGIVIDSSCDAEYDEALLKARFLRVLEPSFSLLESVGLDAQGRVFHLDLHLNRLQTSARALGFPLPVQGLAAALAERGLHSTSPSRATRTGESLVPVAKVRILLDRAGQLSLEHKPDGPLKGPVCLRLAAEPWAEDSLVMRQFKTDRRPHLDIPASGGEVGTGGGLTRDSGQSTSSITTHGPASQTLFWTRDGLLAETSSMNLVLELDGRLLTPATEVGLLEGCQRTWLLQQGLIHQAPLGFADLHRARRIWGINSVRGWVELVLA